MAFPIRQILQNAATSGNGTALLLASGYRRLSIYVDWSTGVSAGEVVVETARTDTYAGTWAPLATISFGANKVNIVQIENIAVLAIRTRISTNVVGGTVTTELVAD